MTSDITDQGWAWVIVVGVTIINLAVLPVQQCFGLIFAERFASLGITATQTSLILHLNGTITCSLGLISGPMMKRFAFRQVAYFGSLTVVLGICAAAFAVSLPTLIITYCVIIGIGQGILFPATTLALNTYFRKKRNVAMGFSVTLTGLGPILMPLLIDVLLENFATTGTLLILAGIASHSLIGASLLKPFRKQTEQSVLMDKITNILKEENSCVDKTNVENNAIQCRLLNKRNAEEEKQPNYCPENSETEVKRNKQTSFLKKIVTNMDLDLLRDNRYIAIVLGMSVSLVAETNFNATIPFVLAELANLDRTSIATIMSIQAAADITGRLCVPLLAQKTGWTCRNLYILSLLGSIFGRTMPPNGGYGWIIVIAGALNALSTIPIVQGFGLIFKESFAKLNLTATDTSIIINVNLAFGMILGLINGPLLKIYGYRKVAMVGSILYAIGITLTAFANTFTLIMISIGMGMSLSGFSLAINTYFTTKRGRAIGMGMTIMGLGPIIMPQILSFLLSFYGVQGTVLILGAYSFHSMIGAILLQPVKWHMINVPILETVIENPKILTDNNDNNDKKILTDNNDKKDITPNHYEEDETSIYSSMLNNNQRKRKTTISSINHDLEVGSIYGFDTPLPRQISTDGTLSYDSSYDIEMSVINKTSRTNLYDNRRDSKYLWNSSKSIDSIHLGSSIKIFDEPILLTKKLTFVDNNVDNNVTKNNDISQNVEDKDSLLEKQTNKYSNKKNSDDYGKNSSFVHRILRRIADLYDFDLLRDPIYVNIMLGMSIAVFAEINFSMLTPFILADMGLTTAKIANIMSILAIADLISRGAAPYLGEWLRLSARMMYMLSLFLLIISRYSLLFAYNSASMVAVAIGLGAAKGIRSVYMALVIPSYVPIQKLPNASGIQMLTNGMILISAGPMLGT
ncbi:MOT9 protein, partial [Acromyrmex heyeri]